MFKWVFGVIGGIVTAGMLFAASSVQAQCLEAFEFKCNSYDTSNAKYQTNYDGITKSWHPSVDGEIVIFINHNCWLFYEDVPLEACYNRIAVHYARKDSGGSLWDSGIKLYLDSLADIGYEGDGTLIADCVLEGTSATDYYVFETLFFPLYMPETVSGNRDMVLSFYGGDWFGKHVCNLKTITFYDSTILDDVAIFSSRKTYSLQQNNVTSSQSGRLLVNLAFQGEAAHKTHSQTMSQSGNVPLAIYDVRGRLLGIADPSRYNSMSDFLNNLNRGSGNKIVIPLEP